MKIAVISAVYNEGANIERFMQSLLGQTRIPDEIILVDDGSTDSTPMLIEQQAIQQPRIKLIRQANQGPASARNQGWRAVASDICLFTDGDCVPEINWVEKIEQILLRHPDAGGAAGTYTTLNQHSSLARVIGLEIAWRYRHKPETIDAHGAYNLAIRKNLLESVGGFNEKYPVPSGEDWDLTYKISAQAPIYFEPEAIVGHFHPDRLGWYLKNQERRAFDRIRVYRDHPAKKSGDAYTGSSDMLQILFAGLVMADFLLSFLSPAFVPFLLISAFVLLLLPLSRILFIYKQTDVQTAGNAAFFFFLRSFAWCIGATRGILRFGFPF